MATPLETYAQANVTRLESLNSAARSELADAETDLRDRKKTHAEALEQLATAEAEVAAVRRALGGSEVAANASTGGEQLRTKLISLQTALAALLTAKLAQLAADDRLALASAELNNVKLKLDDAREHAAKFKARAATLAGWTSALTPTTTLTELPTTANARKGEAAFTDAKAKIESASAGLPEPLRTRVIERLGAVLSDDDDEQAQQATIEDELDSLLAASKGLAGAVVALERALERAEQAAGEYIAQAQRWLDEADARLARIAIRRSLSPSEVAALASSPAREAALLAEKAYDQALADRAEAQRSRAAKVASIYADTSISDPEAEIAADTDIGEHNDAIAAADVIITTYLLGDSPEILRSWEADVPEVAWEDLQDFTLAERLLDRLAAINPSGLLDAITNAETSLADALSSGLAAAQRGEPTITSQLARLRKANTRRLKTADERRGAALRGLR